MAPIKPIKPLTMNTGGLVVITGACVTCARLKYTIHSAGLHNNDYAYLTCMMYHTIGVPFCQDRISIVRQQKTILPHS